MADSPDRRSNGGVAVGDWTFLAGEAVLLRGGERRRLEHRAAEVLSILIGRRGTVVSQAELVDAVWDGRIVSPNSVAVVIADLRRALDDDARSPRHIETISKRGYRLAVGPDAEPAAATANKAPRRAIAGGAILALLLAIGAVLVWRAQSPAPEVVFVAPFANETRDPALAPLTVSSRELVVTAIGRLGTVRLASADAQAGLLITGRLIVWEGHPALALSAQGPDRRNIIWTGMAGGPEAMFPRQVPEQIRSFDAKLARRGLP